MIRAPAAVAKNTSTAACKRHRWRTHLSVARAGFLASLDSPMKSLVLSILILSTFTAFAVEIKTGDSVSQARLELGAPRGDARAGDREILYYDRGEIEARHGVLIRVSLRSADEQAVFESKRSAEAVRVREEKEIREARLNLEGSALKTRKLADPGFLSSPLSYQVAFWEDFSRQYPNVASAEQVLEVRARLASESDEKRRQAEQARRLADLEARLAAAEDEARINRSYGYERFSFGPGYSSFGRSASYRFPRDYCPAPVPVKSVTRMYEYPLPYATSPGMAPLQPAYRKDFSAGVVESVVSPSGNMESAPHSSPTSPKYRRF